MLFTRKLWFVSLSYTCMRPTTGSHQQMQAHDCGNMACTHKPCGTMRSVVRLSEPNRRPANGQRVHCGAKCTQASVSQSTCCRVHAQPLWRHPPMVKRAVTGAASCGLTTRSPCALQPCNVEMRGLTEVRVTLSTDAVLHYGMRLRFSMPKICSAGAGVSATGKRTQNEAGISVDVHATPLHS